MRFLYSSINKRVAGRVQNIPSLLELVEAVGLSGKEKEKSHEINCHK